VRHAVDAAAGIVGVLGDQAVEVAALLRLREDLVGELLGLGLRPRRLRARALEGDQDVGHLDALGFRHKAPYFRRLMMCQPYGLVRGSNPDMPTWPTSSLKPTSPKAGTIFSRGNSSGLFLRTLRLAIMYTPPPVSSERSFISLS